MTQIEYAQKKRECLQDFCKEHGFIETADVKGIFGYAFDRAYALGKETETITQEDVEKAAEKHADELRVSSAIPGALVPMLHDIAKSSYLYGAQDFLGKQKKGTDTVIQGWVARDADGNLFMYSTKPERFETVWMGEAANFDVRNYLFPDLTWESEPEPVEIIIKRKKK